MPMAMQDTGTGLWHPEGVKLCRCGDGRWLDVESPVVALPATLYETLGSPRGLCWKLGLCAFCCSAFTREEMAGSL